MNTILTTLATTYEATNPPRIAFFALDAEEVADVSERYDVTQVPLVVVQKDGKTLESVTGTDAGKVRSAVERHANGGAGGANLPPAQNVSQHANGNGMAKYAPNASDPQTAPQHTANEMNGEQSKEALNQRLSELVKAAPVMLFMKGTPSAPQCGFSRQTVSILREKGVRYGFFNILADDEVRQGLKEFSEWPTFPQIYVSGELIGGLDIVSQNMNVFVDEDLAADSFNSSRKSSRTMQTSSRTTRSMPRSRPHEQLMIGFDFSPLIPTFSGALVAWFSDQVGYVDDEYANIRSYSPRSRSVS